MDHKEDKHSALHIPQVPADGRTEPDAVRLCHFRSACVLALVRRTSSALNCRLSNHLTICPIRSATCAVERSASRRLCDMEASPSPVPTNHCRRKVSNSNISFFATLDNHLICNVGKYETIPHVVLNGSFTQYLFQFKASPDIFYKMKTVAPRRTSSGLLRFELQKGTISWFCLKFKWEVETRSFFVREFYLGQFTPPFPLWHHPKHFWHRSTARPLYCNFSPGGRR